MATSIMESSGSFVVKFCIHIPGAERMRVTHCRGRPRSSDGHNGGLDGCVDGIGEVLDADSIDGQQQLDADAHPDVLPVDVGKHDAGHQDRHDDDHEQKAGAAAGMVLGLGADVLHRQGQPRLIAEDGLMLRAVVAEHPVHVLLLGAEDQIRQKDRDFQKALHHVPAPQGKAGEKVKDPAGKSVGSTRKRKMDIPSPAARPDPR